MSIINKAMESVKGAPDREFEVEDELFQTEYPGIYEWLARVKLNGKSRFGASLTIKMRDGGVSLCLSAETEGKVCWHQGGSVSEALEGLERRLQANTVDWRNRTPQSRR